MVSEGCIGKSLFGYDVIERIGKGAGSVVFAASHGPSRQLCALKHVVVREVRHERFVDQLRAEYDVGQKVRHPGLRRSLDLKVSKSWRGKPTEAALVLELFDGEPLDRRPPATVADALDVFIQTAEALHALHGWGFVHCDLKPGNILLNPAGEVKVIDLGQACPIGTRKGRIQGTPDFISPEQVRCLPVTVRSDVFNLGATMYRVLSGRTMPTLFTVKQSGTSFLVDERVDTPHEVDARVPRGLSNLVMECVRTDPAKRPADMAEVARRLKVVEYGAQIRVAV